MCRPNSSELQKNIQSASTWNFTHMIRCVESRDKGLRANNNVTMIFTERDEFFLNILSYDPSS